MESPEITSLQPDVCQKGFAFKAFAMIFITCVCGWFMMQLEIIGVRLLVPYFGSSTVVVTGSVIGVFLLSLSIGYLIGGWLCGKVNAWMFLGATMIAVGLCKFVIPLVTDHVCEWINDISFKENSDGVYEMIFDERLGSLAASLILFFIPTVLLGTISPTAVGWLTTARGKPGLYAGIVLSFSTIASFSGCVVTAFYLVLFSLSRTLRISGAILAVLGLTVLITAIIGARQSSVNKNIGEANA